MSAADALLEKPDAPIAEPVEPITPEPQPKVENRPLLLVYRDATDKPHVLIAGDGNGTWLLPKYTDITREDLDRHQHTVIPKDSFNIVDFGKPESKPDIAINHQVYSWVPLNLARTILGEQFEHLIPKDAQLEVGNQTKTEARPHQPIAALDVANVDAAATLRPAETHAATCSGCANCKGADAPAHAIIANDAAHVGVSEPTQSMLAAHDTTTHTGAVRT